MKFEESSLTSYLVKHLEPLTEADPAILADYVVALLKKDKPTKDLHELCTDNLVEFLGHGAKSFVAELFQALEDGSAAITNENSDVISKPEPPQFTVIAETTQPISSPPKEENPSTSSEHRSDSGDNEVSDDDDDDRNHKHRRRDARPNSPNSDVQEHAIRRPNRKRKPYDNGGYLESNTGSNEILEELNPASERDASSKFEKRRTGLTPMARAPLELGPRTRVNQTMRTDPGPRFDLSTTIGRPPILGRGRGRSTIPWGRTDSRFNPLDTLDFASQMGPQGPNHHSLFMGTGLPSAVSTQNASWGAYGFIPGMPNRMLDPLLPLNLQGPLQSAINPPLNLGMPRQRCRDFEERGFCLRGDMCPMEHGMNRIVVEDVQSLSQFNLPVSIPSSHTLGVQPGTGSVQQVSAPSSLPTNTKVLPSKHSKSGMPEDTLKLNGPSSVSIGGEADVYDPDQPLWNNDCPEVSGALRRLPSPHIADKALWDADSSARDCSEGEQPSKSVTANIDSQSKNARMWGRSRSGFKTEKGNKANYFALGNERKEDHEEAMANPRASYQGKGLVAEETRPNLPAIKPLPRSRNDFGRNGGGFQKATRTLFVNGIPQKNNRREALLSHFQKFGEVIDIYIPLNSEKAFVQFFKREDAESALKAPDAVMGNRFIKLWWANRDRISDEGQASCHIKSVQTPGPELSTTPSQLYVADREKESISSAVQKESRAPSTGTLLPVTGLPKNPSTPKATPSVQKKVESLELLKEEVRKKHEQLAQKRDELRKQLNKFEKQAILSKKGEIVSEQAVKRHKGDTSNQVAKATTPKSTTLGITRGSQEAERILEKSHSGEVLISPSSKISLTSLEQSPRNINQTSRLPAQLQNRFKLDNRPTSFRILPPLPADLANLAALKDHFSSFGDLADVLLEEPETCSIVAGQGPSQNSSACVTFTTRHSAEKAYINGKCWHGHSLLFAWVKVLPNTNSDSGIQRSPPCVTPKGASNAEVITEQVIPGTSSLHTGKSPCSIIVTTAANGDPMDVEDPNRVPVCASEALVQTSKSSPTMASCEEPIVKSDVAVAKHNTDNGCAE